MSDEIQAKRFVVVGIDGKRRASLGQDFNGSPSLSFYGKEDKGVAVVHLVDDLPQLGFFDKNLKLRMALGVDPVPGGEPRLAFRDKDGANRAVLTVKPNGSPGLVLSHKDHPGALLVVLPDGTTSLTLYDKKNPRVGFGVQPDGSPSLSFDDKDEMTRFVLKMLPDGSPQTILADKGGKVIWRAP